MFRAHLLTGVCAAAVILVMSATGVLLAYQRQIQSWADTRGLDGNPPAAAAPLLAPDALLERVGQRRAARPTGLRWRRDPGAPVEVLYGRDAVAFVNGYTGILLGDGSERTRAFFRGVTEWHRWLALSGSGRMRGRAITGAANLAFLFLVLAGFYLWWPRSLTGRSFRNVLLFRRGLRSRARHFNWHNVIGIWSLVPLLIMIGSATVISYAWAGSLVTSLTEEESAAAAASRRPATARAAVPAPGGPVATPAEPGGGGGAWAAGCGDAGPAAETEALLGRAGAQMPGWRSITMQLPQRNETVSLLVDGGTGGQPQKQARLTFSCETGGIVAWEPFSTGARTQRVRSILRYAHTGEVLGVAGQAIAGLASAGAVLLVWTGMSLALARFRSRVRRLEAPPGVLPRPQDAD